MANSGCLTTDVGLALISAAMAASANKYIGWGIGTADAAVGDTGLGNASAESRTSGTQSQQSTGGTTNDTYRCVGSITCASAGKAITEVCIFSASTSGTCYMRACFAAINVNVGDSIQFTIDNIYNQA
jgi:hypothetical protein